MANVLQCTCETSYSADFTHDNDCPTFFRYNRTAPNNMNLNELDSLKQLLEKLLQDDRCQGTDVRITSEVIELVEEIIELRTYHEHAKH